MWSLDLCLNLSLKIIKVCVREILDESFYFVEFIVFCFIKWVYLYLFRRVILRIKCDNGCESVLEIERVVYIKGVYIIDFLNFCKRNFCGVSKFLVEFKFFFWM